MTATTSLRGDLPRPARPPAAPGPGVTGPGPRAGCGCAPPSWPAAAGSTPAAATLTLADLRGRIVVLDFWTFCCVNCLHVLDELRPARGAVRRLAGPDRRALAEVRARGRPGRARRRGRALCRAATRCWTTPSWSPGRPTPPGPGPRWWSSTPRATSSRPCRVRATRTGSRSSSTSWSRSTRPRARCAAATRRTCRRRRASTALRFPGKAAALPDGSFLVSDTAHHQLVHLEADLVTERARIGGDGHVQRAAGRARRCLPRSPARVGYDVVVADSVHHQVKGVRLADGSVVTLAGTGRQLRERSGSGPALRQDLSTPWDLAWFIDRVVDRHGRHAPAVGAAPGPGPRRQHRRGAGRHLGRGHPRRCRPRCVVRPALRPGHLRRRSTPVGRRLRDLRAALAHPRPATASRSPPTSGRDCSTSATATAPPARR